MQILKLGFLLLLVYSNLWSQNISGIVVEKESNTPLIGAHIYIKNSLQGAVSDANGEFTLNPPNTYGELLVTYVGYQDLKIEFSPSSKELVITLIPLSNRLEEVSVNSTEDKKWKKLYKKFESSFLGNTKNAGFCVITNPWVVDVTKGPNGEILAHSTRPIEIINNALGYKLTFHLTGFTLKANRLHYQGDVYFSELVQKMPTDKPIWSKNRKETFRGSKRHFVMALNSQILEKEGFEVYSSSFSPEIGFTTNKRMKEVSLLRDQHTLSIPDYLKIVYTKAEPQRAYLSKNQSQSFAFQGPKADLVPKGNLQMSSQYVDNQVSHLYSRNSELLFTDKGLIINAKYIIEYGYWSWLGVAEMLPYEYEPEID